MLKAAMKRHQELRQLLALQGADRRLASLARRHFALLQARERDRSLRELNDELAREQLRRLRAENERLSDLSWELADLEQRLQELRAQNPGGDVLLVREIQSLQRRHDELEEYVLEQMLRTDELSRSAPVEQQQTDQLDARIGRHEQRLWALLARVESQIAQTDARRRQLAASLPAGMLARYEALRPLTDNRPLARVREARCEVCVSPIPADLAAVEQPSCPGCGRLLLFL
jgi:hypothetical protein